MKKQYIAPRITAFPTATENLLDTVSLPIGPGPAPGPSEGKVGEFDEEVDEQGFVNNSPWED